MSLFRSPRVPGASWRMLLGGVLGVVLGALLLGGVFHGLAVLAASSKSNTPGFLDAVFGNMSAMMLMSPLVTWVGLIPACLLAIPAARSGWAGPGTAIATAAVFFGVAGFLNGGFYTMYLWSVAAMPFALLFWAGAWLLEPRLRTDRASG
ncbi:MAG: hypothetical protein GVY31_08000 [Alphaproteobacteria bacterium]|jgi:hypothetical protein|nr:hypothetical protein [Alphaproteobacteria bacterium]